MTVTRRMFFGMLLLFVASVVVLVVAAINQDDRMERQCARAGYPRLVLLGREWYCARVRNATDELVPLSEVSK